MNKKTISGLIVLLIIALIIISSFFLFKPKEVGDKARVLIDGKVSGEYSLSEDGIFVLNNGTNTMEIKSGKVRMKDALCPDKICVKEGWKNKNGECITCLPSHLVIEVIKENGEVDLVL